MLATIHRKKTNVNDKQMETLQDSFMAYNAINETKNVVIFANGMVKEQSYQLLIH